VEGNVQELLKSSLPQLSPYHISLLHSLNKKLPCQHALQLFSICAPIHT